MKILKDVLKSVVVVVVVVVDVDLVVLVVLVAAVVRCTFSLATDIKSLFALCLYKEIERSLHFILESL